MIARPTDIPQAGVSAAEVPAAETPLQRQILLWQRELLRREVYGPSGIRTQDLRIMSPLL